MLKLYEWISLAQWAVMGVTTILLWRMRSSVHDAVDKATLHRRIQSAEQEIDRLREWRHKELIPWQQVLLEKMDERFVTRREYETRDDSPWPSNERRKRPR